MNILLIGNSYAVDATRYLHKIARSEGEDITTVCLYIGGCSLEYHHRNMHSGLPKYELFINGEKSGFFVSLKEALTNRPWDIITLQQASHHSFDYDNYQPYLNNLSEYVKTICPKAKQYIHETWCDAPESPRLEGFKFASNKEMMEEVKKTYYRAKEEINADGILKSGELILKLYENGLSPVWRDHGHVSYGIGRFATALLWYKTLLNKDIKDVKYNDFDEPISEEEIKLIKKCIDEIAL